MAARLVRACPYFQFLSEHASGSRVSTPDLDKAALCDARGVTRFLICPILRRRLRVLEFLCVLIAGRHRGGCAREHLVMIDVEQPQPALLAERQSDHAAKLD